MAMYLTTGKQRWLARGLMASGLTMMVGGAMLAVANPQLHNQRAYEDAWLSGRLQSTLPSRQASDKRGQALGSLLSAFGLLLGSGGLYLAPGDPEQLRPETLPTQRPRAAGAPPEPMPPEDVVMTELKAKLTAIVANNDWLRQSLMAYSVVLVGDSGSGKSTVANAIAVLRTILWGWQTSQFDPHAKENMQFKTWMVGRIYGLSNPEVEILEGLKAALEPFPQFAKDNRTRHTVICDEFTGWADGSYATLQPMAEQVLSHGLRNARKQGHAMIYLLHGDKKGTAGGESLGSGILQRLLKQSAVLQIDGKADEWGQVGWAGTGKFKAPAQDYADGNLQPIVIPELLGPGRLQREIADLLEYLGYGLDTKPQQSDREASPQYQAIQAQVAEAITPERLEMLYRGPSAAGATPDELMPQWEAVRAEPLMVSLLSYCYQKRWQTVDVARLKGSWGKVNGVTAKEQVRAMVDAFIEAHLAEWSAVNRDGQGSEFRLLPRWENWPTWLKG
jgi:hypothetical protein